MSELTPRRVTKESDAIAFARADLPAFSRWPLGYENHTELAEHQVAWQELFQEHIEAKLGRVSGARNLCILGPSEHGKTYGLDAPAILWTLSRYWKNLHGLASIHGRNLRIGILGSKESKAAKIGTVLDRHFKTRGKDLAKFGLIPDYPWNSSEKTLERQDEKDTEPSIVCFGPESEIQGGRFDVLFITDFFTIKNQRTQAVRQSLMEYLDLSVYNRMEEVSFIFAAGHRVHEQDGYSVWAEDTENWNVVTYKSILEEPTQDNGLKPKVLWPSKWPYEKLDKIRRSRPRAFELTFQNSATRSSTHIDRASFERCLDRGRPLYNHMDPDLRLAFKKIRLEHDPAFTNGPKSASSVVLVWGVHHDGREDLIGGWALKLLPPQLKRKIISTCAAFMPDDIYIESNAQQPYYIYEVKSALAEYKLDSRVREVYTRDDGLGDDGAGPANSEVYVGRFVEAMDKGRISLPFLGAAARDLSSTLFQQIVDWPAKPNDVIMCKVIGMDGEARQEHQERKVHQMPKSLMQMVSEQVHHSRGTSRPGLFDHLLPGSNAPK